MVLLVSDIDVRKCGRVNVHAAAYRVVKPDGCALEEALLVNRADTHHLRGRGRRERVNQALSVKVDSIIQRWCRRAVQVCAVQMSMRLGKELEYVNAPQASS